MSAKNDGGPAFPVTIENRTSEAVSIYGVIVKPRTKVDCYGVSVREFYAAHALSGILAIETNIKPDIASQMAFDQADSMLEEGFK